jgi:transposase, IS5 family
MLPIMARMVRPQRGDKSQVYNLHGPAVSWFAKGKAPKQDALGSKVSVASWSGSHVVVGSTSFVGNPHDGKTLATALDQVAQWAGQRYKRVLVDQGDRSHGPVGGAAVMIPGKKSHASTYSFRRYQTLCKAARR